MRYIRTLTTAREREKGEDLLSQGRHIKVEKTKCPYQNQHNGFINPNILILQHIVSFWSPSCINLYKTGSGESSVFSHKQSKQFQWCTQTVIYLFTYLSRMPYQKSAISGSDTEILCQENESPVWLMCHSQSLKYHLIKLSRTSPEQSANFTHKLQKFSNN